MKTLELNHVAVYATDLKRSVEFYEKVLKLTPIPRPSFNFPGTWFQLGTNQELHLIAELGDPFFQKPPQ
jgi:catechol 2,3-dioxygenase-like lactoylglutathione lyase family enzyme